MTTAHAPQGSDSSLARGWRSFRRWRRGRPFWGGLFLLLAGLELFLSSNLDLGNLQVHFGPTGFLSYVIPAMLLLCGLLTWLSPGQRLFYGILGTLVAVFSLIGLNLGGFVLGLVLGCLGGALTVAWMPNRSPVTAAPPAEAPAPGADEDPGAVSLADLDFGEDPTDPDRAMPPPVGYQAPPVPEGSMLTDQLPTSLRSPLDGYEPRYGPRHAAGGGGAGSADDERPPGPGHLPRRRLRQLPTALALLALATVVAGVTQRPTPAGAAPACPPASSKTTAPAVPEGGTATTSPPTQPAPTETSAPAVAAARGLAAAAADPTPSASPSASGPTTPPPTDPAPDPTSTPGGEPTPGTTASGPCPPSASPSAPEKPKIAALDAGQPAVASHPSTITSAFVRMSGLSFDGVVDLPTKTGTVKVLRFSMTTSELVPFRLSVPGGPTPFLTISDRMVLSGNVRFYASRFSGNVLGLIPLTFTPSEPPPLILPELFFTDCDIDLVFVQTESLAAANLSLRFAG